MIKTFKAKCNGRGAWLALWSYYLGPNNLDHMASEAEKSLASVHYNGESRNFTFDKFLMHMLKQHNIIEGLETHGLVTDMTERRKVFILLEGIKSSPSNLMLSRKGSCRMTTSGTTKTSASRCLRTLSVRTTWKQPAPRYPPWGVKLYQPEQRTIVTFLQ